MDLIASVLGNCLYFTFYNQVFQKQLQCILETKERGVVIVTLRFENGTVDFVPVYIYLEVHLNEHIDVCIIADSLSKADGVALGAVITKLQSYKDVGFKTYSKLYN